MIKSQLVAGGAFFLWLTAIGAGMAYLAHYSQQPGEFRGAPARIAPRAIESPCKHRLLMFVHPRCPCSRASLRELQRLMSRCNSEIEATIYFIRPENETDAWTHGSLWDLAQGIPGVTVEVDAGGERAKEFSATTSGSIVVYDPAGNLQFQGGITAARGHEGDSLGKAAIFAIARGDLGEGQHVAPATGCSSPVFGCALQNKASEPSITDDRP